MALLEAIISRLPQSTQEWMIPPMPIPDVHNDPSKIQLIRLGHVYFEHRNLKEFERFAKDFGFNEERRIGNTIYYRGYGKDPYVYVASQSQTRSSNFLGAAFVAKDEENFQKATKLEGAIVKDLTHAPGGGRLVTIPRPNGTFMHVIYGQEEREVNTAELPSQIIESHGPFNEPFKKGRFGVFQRFKPAPALVHKVGHFGYVCCEFDQEFEFYTKNFNIVPSDILSHEKFGWVDFMTFMHLDLARAPPGTAKTYVHHTSYEVADFDTQLMGHRYLENQKWRPVWGVGRHVLGSQIFDYWLDSSGFKVEHYADGDLVNINYKNKRSVAGPMAIWGPEIPNDFAKSKAG
ncbi:oxidoreductase, putative [Talaromyces stipitatus ATCC 10500]|uniref:Oxidoreductase, putative n=1 Tax=Talaromyces stipitatus (strain ATCC 10500 / CBS 375.48 / QM 6759 / NRRL 1006) TaxID=441959 RepID=B8MRV4_TALSN|nr:oxidoreductase, putative [Talaromyces stipitatus ATCC 10500]EED13287.1 oxidoreductase, putative [Talaromyces stipitatus ATCC 10500]